MEKIRLILDILSNEAIGTSFPFAVKKLLDGKRIARLSGNGTFFEVQKVTDRSKMTKPYIYKVDGYDYTPYTFANEDLFATDWVVI
jgi:hypothetical protein